MKQYFIFLSVIGMLSTAQAGKFDNADWEKLADKFAQAHSGQIKQTTYNVDNRTNTVRMFARNMYENIYQANYRGSNIVSTPFDVEPRVNFFREDANEFLQVMHTHFAKELNGFDIDSIFFQIPNTKVAHLYKNAK